MNYTLTPVEWHSALTETPHERSLWLGMADWLEDRGESLAAESLRYAVAADWQLNFGGSRVSWNSSDLWRFAHSRDRDVSVWLTTFLRYTGEFTVVHAFNRLLASWQAITPEQREELWRSIPAVTA